MADERSKVWDVAAWASLAGGATLGGIKAHPALSNAIGAGNRDIAQETSARMRDIGRFNVGKMTSSFVPVDDTAISTISNLSRTSSMSIVKGDIASATYESLLRGGRISQQEAYQIHKNIFNSSSAEDAYQQAAAAIGQYKGNAQVLSDRLSKLGTSGFYGDVLDPLTGGSKQTGRLSEISKTSLVSNQFANIRRRTVSISDMPLDVQQNITDIQQRLGKASGGRIGQWELFSIKDTIGGKEVVTPFMRGKINRETLNIPLKNTGITYGGEHLTSRYITRRAYQGGTSDFQTYTQRYVNALEESMAVQKTNTGLKNAVIDTNHQILENLHTEGAAARSQAIWTMPEAVLPAGGRVRARMNVRQAVYAGPGNLTAEARDKIIAQTMSSGKGLYPYGGPDVVAKGTMMTRDVAEEIYGPMAHLMGVEERPLQFIREQWGVTAEAKAAAPEFKGAFGKHFSRLEQKIQGAGHRNLLYGGASPLSAEAYSAPQLTAFYAKPELLETGELGKKMFQEEMLISKKMTGAMEYERVVQKKIVLDEGFRVNTGLLDALKGKSMGELQMLDSPISSGQFLGIERGTGKELWSEAGEAEANVIAAELSGDKTATVYMREKHKLDRGQWWKFFSEDVKFMGQARTQKEMTEMLQTAGVADIIGGQQVEAIASGKLVGRNKIALMKQQIEAMSMFIGERMDESLIPTAYQDSARKFMQDPSVFLGIEELSNKNINAGLVEQNIRKRMISLAKEVDFSRSEMQLAFGLMDRQGLVDLVKGGNLTLREAAHIRRSSGVVGLSKMRLGHLASEGVGGLGSFEQTGFRALAMKGEEGQLFAAEMATRLSGKGESIAANRMTASMIGEELPERMNQLFGRAPIDERKLSQFKNIDELLQETGRYVDVGQKLEAFGGKSKIYIPGIAEAESMLTPSLSNKGQVIPSQIVKNLDELRYLSAKGAGKEELEISAKTLRDKVVMATESQSAARGKVYGSRFLTGIRQTAAESKDVFKISERTAGGMFDDLLKRAKSADQKAFLTDQKRKLLEEGETLVGGMWRHPTTGPESFQFVKYQVDKNLADEIISAPYKMGELSIGGKTQKLDFSQMVGMKGDFDKDMFAISAIGERDTAKRIAKNMDGSIQKNYTNYLFNHYAMKDMVDAGKNQTKTLLEMSRTEALQTGAEKLTTAKIATPQVNVALQKLKLGMQSAAPEKYRPMAELFWHMEEAAIGGKHSTQQSKLYQGIAHAVQQKDSTTMESVIKQLMGEKDRVISGRITSPTGEITTHTLRYSPKEYAEQAINAAASVSDDVDYAYKSAKAAKGAGVSSDINELVTMYYKRRTGSVDVAQSVMQAKDYGAEGFTQRTNRLLRQASVKKSFISKALRAAKGPLMAGAAIAAGVMLAAPAVSGVMPNKEGPAGGKNLRPNDLGPPSGFGMSPPPARIMASPKAYDMSGIKMSSRANIRMSMPDADNTSVDFMRQASQLASNGNVKIRTTDDRSVLNPQRLASKIHERL